MKTRFFISCFFVCAAILSFNATAATFVDDMLNAKNSDYKSYNNLTIQSYRPATALPDATSLTFANISKPVGSAVYLATGVEAVKAAVYTHVGTLVTRQPGDGAYMLGVFQSNIAETMQANPLQAIYCLQTYGIYTEAGGLKQASTDTTCYQFIPVVIPPQGELIGYGINIYYSFDGTRFTRAPMTDFSYNYDSNFLYCYEEYTAAVPRSSKMIKVEINDAYELPLTTGGMYKKEARYMTSIASVVFNGAKISLGPEKSLSDQPANEAIPPPDYVVPDMAESYAEQKAVKTKDEEDVEEDAEYIDSVKTEDTVETESSSKFSGTITSSSRERSSSSAKSRSQSTEASDSGEVPHAAREEGEARGESQTYNISRGQENSSFNRAVVAYIVVVSSAIVFVVVLPRK